MHVATLSTRSLSSTWREVLFSNLYLQFFQGIMPAVFHNLVYASGISISKMLPIP